MSIFRKVKVLVVSLGLLLSSLSFQALADVNALLRSEIDAYKDGINKLSGQELIILADQLSGSGVVDEELYTVVRERTKKEFTNHFGYSDKTQLKATVSLIRALGSFGRFEDRAFFLDMTQSGKARGIRNRAKQSNKKLGWFKKRNEIMQDTSYYEEGQKLSTHKFLALIHSKDLTMRRWAAEEINRRGGADNVVFKTMAKMVREEAPTATDKVHLDTMAWFCRVLSTHDAINHREFLIDLKNSAQVPYKIKKHIKI